MAAKKIKMIRRAAVHWMVYAAAKFGLWLGGCLPDKWVSKVGETAGRLAFRLAGRERRRAMTGLVTAFSREGKSLAELKNIAASNFRHLGRSFFELAGFYRSCPPKVCSHIRIEGLEHIDHALGQGKGVIMVTAHLGNWELFAYHIASLGYPVTVVARQITNEKINQLILDLRERYGVQTVLRKKRGHVQKGILKTLRDNRILGILMDQDTHTEGVFVDFFGRPAYTPSGAVVLALRTGAAILPGFITRLDDGSHRIQVLPQIKLYNAPNQEETVRLNTQYISNIIENYVRQYPEQWVWMHRRWKTQPPSAGQSEVEYRRGVSH